MMAGVYKSHPNNVIYLTEKYRLDTKDISNLLSMIEPDQRQRYNYENIEKLYTEYVAVKVDDYNTIEMLKNSFEGKNVLILAPGNTLNTHKGTISDYINSKHPVIVSVNYISEYQDAFAFFGNKKRYNKIGEFVEKPNIIVTSNIHADSNQSIVVNYHSLINRGYVYFENSTIMLLNLLKKLNPNHIAIAGFDGFDKMIDMNYSDRTFQDQRHVHEFERLNSEIGKMLNDVVQTLKGKCEIELITPSIYQHFIQRNW